MTERRAIKDVTTFISSNFQTSKETPYLNVDPSTATLPTPTRANRVHQSVGEATTNPMIHTHGSHSSVLRKDTFLPSWRLSNVIGEPWPPLVLLPITPDLTVKYNTRLWSTLFVSSSALSLSAAVPPRGALFTTRPVRVARGKVLVSESSQNPEKRANRPH